MNEYEVTCVTRNSAIYDRYRSITHIGNTLQNWRLRKEAAIQRIETKSEAFYTIDRQTGQKAYIGVVRPSDGQPYLRTYANGQWNDNLISLPESSIKLSDVA